MHGDSHNTKGLGDWLQHLNEDGRSANGVVRLLDDLQLPQPGPGEFICSHAGGIFFHPTAGVVIRIEQTEEKLKLAKHPLVSEPLGALAVGDWRIELCEGLRTNKITDRDVDWLFQTLKQDHILWSDAYSTSGGVHLGSRVDNVGRLPLTTPEFPNGLPVVMDRERVYSFESSPYLSLWKAAYFGLRRKASEAFNGPARLPRLEDYGVPAEQAVAYRAVRQELRNLMDHVLGADGGVVQSVVTEFWAVCHAHTQAAGDVERPAPGALCRGWDEGVSPFSIGDDKALAASRAAQTLRQRITQSPSSPSGLGLA